MIEPACGTMNGARPAEEPLVTVTELLESLFGAWNQGDALRAGAHFALDARYQEARHEPIAGRDAIVAHFTAFFRDGPAWRFHVEDILHHAERAAIRYRFETAQPDGSWRSRDGCAFVTLRDGTLAEWREYEG
jgi:ketosteroid isomerase-like protein